MKDIHISNCEFTSLCAGIRIGLKSIGDIYNVVISNCTMDRVWREGIKIECTEGGSISDIMIQNVTMRDVTRPVFMILNNRFKTDDYGSSVELEQMPEIGRMENITITHLTAVDSEEMKNTHYRFGNDIMGEPKFNGHPHRCGGTSSDPGRDFTEYLLPEYRWGKEGRHSRGIPAGAGSTAASGRGDLGELLSRLEAGRHIWISGMWRNCIWTISALNAWNRMRGNRT